MGGFIYVCLYHLIDMRQTSNLMIDLRVIEYVVSLIVEVLQMHEKLDDFVSAWLDSTEQPKDLEHACFSLIKQFDFIAMASFVALAVITKTLGLLQELIG
ncbi:hypothetical protein HAX54_026677 [Datura stramonium]|uniref:Uncharacterized protein n=1 Tax=Datura stramonium TaxID=4076 RepID=A0ABS8S833_DATST|nr:hypothetical protein [Datura stramonium]